MKGILSLITIKPKNHCFSGGGNLSFSILIVLFTLFNFQGFCLNPDKKPKTFVVTIDPGHGGKDPGATGKKTVEKKLTLAIGLKVGHYIESMMDNVKVVYTRSTDVFIPLDERANIANQNRSDLFISIHVDGFKSSTPKGTSSFVMGTSKTSVNFDLVKRENRVITLEDNYQEKYENFDPNDPASYIKFNLYQSVNLKQSLLFATLVQDELRVKAQRVDRGVSQEPFMVLWRTTMPSVLVETGFISNPQEEEFLITENGQNIIATSIFTAIRKYRQDLDDSDEDKAGISTARQSDSFAQERLNRIIEAERIRTEQFQTEKDTARPGSLESKGTPVKVNVENKNSTPKAGEIEFRIQILASTRPLAPSAPDFKGRKGFEAIKLDGYYKYMTRPVKTYPEALALRKELSTLFKGAFIVAFKGGIRVPLNEAVGE